MSYKKVRELLESVVSGLDTRDMDQRGIISIANALCALSEAIETDMDLIKKSLTENSTPP